MISAVIQTCNDAAPLTATLASLAPAALDGFLCEVIVADGGSSDDTLAIAEDAGARILSAAGEMAFAQALAAARQPWLLILKPGTRLQIGWLEPVLGHVRQAPAKAGWFHLALTSPALSARLAEVAAELRSKTGRPGAQQGLLVSSRLYSERGAGAASHAQLVRALGPGRLRPLPARALNGSL